MEINKTFQRNIIGLYGDRGKLWLDQLPELLKEFEQKLDINIHQSFDNLSFNYVAPCTLADGKHAVFKCVVPNKELTTEIAALKHFNGNGCAKLINSDPESRWVIIERLEPGALLSSVKNDEIATRTFVNVMQQLHKSIELDDEFPTIETWLKGFERLHQEFNGGTGPFPKELVDYAEKLSKELLQSSSKRVLLHGDLHHYNILSSKRDFWLAIDPKGVIGEPEYEVGAFMKNPMPGLMFLNNVEELLVRRIDIIAEMTGFDRQRLLAWAFVKAILTAWWCYEGKIDGIKILLPYAEILKSLINERIK
jgi:streptomycin 6-kinase